MRTTMPEAPSAPSTPLISINVLHNVDRDSWEGYLPGHPLRYVGNVTVGLHDEFDVMLDDVYALLNGGAQGEAETYRKRGNRSLSVGDVLVIDGVAFAVSGLGFDRVKVDPAQVTRTGTGRCSVGIDEVR